MYLDLESIIATTKESQKTLHSDKPRHRTLPMKYTSKKTRPLTRLQDFLAEHRPRFQFYIITPCSVSSVFNPLVPGTTSHFLPPISQPHLSNPPFSLVRRNPLTCWPVDLSSGCKGVEEKCFGQPFPPKNFTSWLFGLDRIGLDWVYFVDWFFERNEGGEGRRGERIGGGGKEEG